MTLPPKFLLILSLFQISLGLGWILGYVLLPPTIFCYEQAAEHLLAGEYRTVRPEGLNTENSIVLQPYDYFNKGQTAQLPVVSLHRESSLNSFASYPPNPMDYTVLFRHLYEQGAKNVYVMSPMTWEEKPDSIVKAAVGYELDRFLHKALGRQMSESARRSPLPPDWKDLIIPASNIVGKTDQFPRADRFVGEPPQITTSAPSLGTVVENNELFSPAPENRVSPPLFIRWGGDIIPTLPLVAALNALDLKPGDVRIIPGDTLFLGGKRSIPLDKNGRIPLAANSSPTILDTKEVIVPVMSGLRPPDTTAVRKTAFLCGCGTRFRTIRPFRHAGRAIPSGGANCPQHHGSACPCPCRPDSHSPRLGTMDHRAGRPASVRMGFAFSTQRALHHLGPLYPVRSLHCMVPVFRS